MNSVAGTQILLRRLVMRRDRVLLGVWGYSFLIVPASFAYSFAKLYPTAAERARFVATSQGSGVFTALYGRLYGSSLGDLVAWRSGFMLVVAAVLAIIGIIRNTRVEEESGRTELVGSTAVGRHTGLAAALAESLVANLTVLVFATVALVLVKRLPVAGSLALAAEFAAAGLIFAAVAAVAAQLTTSATAARAIAFCVLGAVYLFRMIGDLSANAGNGWSWVSWLSPFYWQQQIRPYGGNRWWFLLPAVALIAVLIVAAVALASRRDVGSGLLPDRPGRATAPGFRSPLALAWRLHRGLVAGWTAAFAVVGVVYGGLGKSIPSLLNSNHSVQTYFTRLGGQSAAVDAYLAAIMGFMGLIAAAYSIQATLKLRDEETSGRAEPVLATGTGRLKWVGSHLVFSAMGPAVAILAAGLTTGLTYGLAIGHVGLEVSRLLGAALVQLPAIWVLTAITLALFGLLPGYSVTASWGVLGACLLISMVGPSVQLSHWVLDISPFVHVPRLPGTAVSATPLAWLAAIVVVVAAVGLTGIRRRDIPA